MAIGGTSVKFFSPLAVSERRREEFGKTFLAVSECRREKLRKTFLAVSECRREEFKEDLPRRKRV